MVVAVVLVVVLTSYSIGTQQLLLRGKVAGA